MNCAECRDNFIACAEGLLDRGESLQCRAHLESCAPCRKEYEALTSLQQRLTVRGQAAAGVGIVAPVMRRVRQELFQPEKESIMSRLMKHRWGVGLGATAGAAALGLIILLAVPRAQATAVGVMTRGAQALARLTQVHLRGELRTLPGDNFSYINADCEFSRVELWKQFDPELRWRIEKPNRVIVMDGQSTVMLMGKVGVKLPQRTTSAFDTEWLHQIANLSATITDELKRAQARGWKLTLDQVTGADGKQKSVVTVLAKSGLPEDDYCKNSFFQNADTRRVYRFDDQSELLEAVQVYLVRPAGEVQILNLNQIEFNQPQDPTRWQLEIPKDVSWASLDVPKLADNEKYAALTAEQAARAFFEACSRKDWEEVGKFLSPVTEGVKQNYGGLEIVSLGEAFTSQAYGGRFVPYEVKLRSQEFNVRVSNTNAAKRFVVEGFCDDNLQLVQDFKWSTAPEILPNNEVYARLTPKEVVQAYFDAQAKLDWVEMRKFTSQYDIDTTKQQTAMAQKQGIDVTKMMPAFQVGEAVWSPGQSAWFVKCSVAQTKKWNLAVRKDNPAGRWQVDGGF